MTLGTLRADRQQPVSATPAPPHPYLRRQLPAPCGVRDHQRREAPASQGSCGASHPCRYCCSICRAVSYASADESRLCHDVVTHADCHKQFVCSDGRRCASCDGDLASVAPRRLERAPWEHLSRWQPRLYRHRHGGRAVWAAHEGVKPVVCLDAGDDDVVACIVVAWVVDEPNGSTHMEDSTRTSSRGSADMSLR